MKTTLNEIQFYLMRLVRFLLCLSYTTPLHTLVILKLLLYGRTIIHIFSFYSIYSPFTSSQPDFIWQVKISFFLAGKSISFHQLLTLCKSIALFCYWRESTKSSVTKIKKDFLSSVVPPIITANQKTSFSVGDFSKIKCRRTFSL